LIYLLGYVEEVTFMEKQNSSGVHHGPVSEEPGERTAAAHLRGESARADQSRPSQTALERQQPCFVIGIGASAGGQPALEQLFTVMPNDCNLSFVVVMHLPAEGPALLAEMLGRYTPMEVVTAEHGMPLVANRVQVIPPGSELMVQDGMILLEKRQGPIGTYHPIDRFFRSLAEDAGANAVAVLLSGSGIDGGEGVRAVREAGGIVLVQEPSSAVYPSMPANAVATGAAHFVLAAEEMPERIAEIARGTCPLSPGECHTATVEEELAAILGIVKARTGHDFSSYKQNTVMRRIERRMAVNEAAGLNKYICLLESNPQEAQALGQEILIGVTSFFRDPDAFAVLKKLIPRLFAGRHSDDPVRIWHACCATGEEVYSMAMLIREYLDGQGLDLRVQLFATDLDEVAISQARAGIYPDDIAAEIGEQRLKSFFTRLDGRWQVSKALREMVVFAHHSLVKDPPFSRLDLLVCRNFLIYLNPDMQKRLISLFHLVLRPGGILFLGASESVGRNSDLFTPIDKKWKIFERLESGRRGDTMFPFTTPIRRVARTGPSPRPAASREPGPGEVAEKLLLERYSPPCVVINQNFDVVYFSTRTGKYLEPPVGEPSRNILKMAKENLRPALRAAVYKAFSEQREVAFRGVKIAGEEAVNVLVEPLSVGQSSEKLVLVVLEAAVLPPALPLSAGPESLPPGDESSKDLLIHQLEEQLRVTHEQLQATLEQLETSHEGFMSSSEELMSINEEFQSTNEELQSTNEEMETSKEELQALNEELSTVNAELQGKVEELNKLYSDMENLFSSSQIATIFLDRQLTIKRFSPAMASIFNLISADIGRPFRYLAGTIDWPELPGDVQSVLSSLTPVEREVRAVEDGRCFLARVLPYRTTEGSVDGIVITLIDISARKRAEEGLQASRLREQERSTELESLMEAVPALVWIAHDAQCRNMTGNRAVYDLLNKPVGANVANSSLPDEPPRSFRKCRGGFPIPTDDLPLQKAARTGLPVLDEEIELRFDNGSSRWILGSAVPLFEANGTVRGAIGAFLDVTQRKRADEEVRGNVEKLRSSNEALKRFNSASVGRELRMIALKQEVNELCLQAGLSMRYTLDFLKDEA
jgi:two-component system, chemotaxis family, CheB/CheR fusion protein